jgi:uncharacterized protein YbjT (DUF2867 family)
MSKLVTIYGGSGFVGRYVARRLAKEGWRVRVAVRRPNEAIFVRPYGAPGQVEPVLCNIRDDASVRAAMAGADAVVNCVGVMNALGKNSFEAVQAEGAGRVARLAAETGVAHLVHLSALGASAESDATYYKTKAAGEAAVLAAYPSAVILRPSVIFGTGDSFFSRLGGLARSFPLVPVVGANAALQPVYVEDVAQAAVLGATGAAAPGIYELGGPEVMTMREAQARVVAEVERKRVLLPVPAVFARLLALPFDLLQGLTRGLIANKVLTRDQVRMLAGPNVVSQGARGFEALGITPTAVDAVLPEYLWPYRPSGQYAAIKNSARKVRV